MLGIINVIATDSGLAAGIWVAQASRLLLKVLSLSKEPPPCSRQNELFLTGGMALTNARFQKVRAGETPTPTGGTPVLPGRNPDRASPNLMHMTCRGAHCVGVEPGVVAPSIFRQPSGLQTRRRLTYFRLPSLRLALFLHFSFSSFAFAADDIATLYLEPGPNMTRAELQYVKTVSNPRAVLVLCPGVNGSGEGLIRENAWREFARQNKLGLVGLSFAAPEPAIHDGTGYYYASKGSGDKLLEGIEKIYHRKLPILLYGFSGGAHFTSRFEEWMPQRVIAWCADSAAWWDIPVRSESEPPGIVACGDKDERYGASLTYFKQGRAAGKPWLWVSLANLDHATSPKLEEFVRSYFATVLNAGAENQQTGATPQIVDIDRKTVVAASEAQAIPSITGWLPSDKLFHDWCAIHEP